jgi:hypothetical protein
MESGTSAPMNTGRNRCDFEPPDSVIIAQTDVEGIGDQDGGI